MRKRFAVVCIVLGLFCMFLNGASAVSLPDGTYEVPIELRHAEEDKTSMGNSYVVGTGILEVSGGNAYLTMASDSVIPGMQFWYYNDGSVSGDSTEVPSAGTVTIAGEEYSTTFRFPLMGDGQLVGVIFKAPIMPVKPSARVYIDYDSAVALSSPSATEAPVTDVPAAAPVTDVPTAAPETTPAASAPADNAPTDAPQATEPPAAETTVLAAATEPAEPTTALAAQQTEEAEESGAETAASSGGFGAGFLTALAVVLVLVLIAFCIARAVQYRNRYPK